MLILGDLFTSTDKSLIMDFNYFAWLTKGV